MTPFVTSDASLPEEILVTVGTGSADGNAA